MWWHRRPCLWRWRGRPSADTPARRPVPPGHILHVVAQASLPLAVARSAFGRHTGTEAGATRGTSYMWWHRRPCLWRWRGRPSADTPVRRPVPQGRRAPGHSLHAVAQASLPVAVAWSAFGRHTGTEAGATGRKGTRALPTCGGTGVHACGGGAVGLRPTHRHGGRCHREEGHLGTSYMRWHRRPCLWRWRGYGLRVPQPEYS